MKQSNKNIKFTRKLRNISLLNKKIIFDKKILHNLSSNDYLSLSKNKDLISASNLWTKNFGTSLSSSRLISGNFDKIGELEKKIAKHKSKQEANLHNLFETRVYRCLHKQKNVYVAEC